VSLLLSATGLGDLALLERVERVVGEVLDRLELRRQIVVEVGPLKRCGGETRDRCDRRTQSVLVGFDVVDTDSHARRARRGQTETSVRHNRWVVARDTRTRLPFEVVLVWMLYLLDALAVLVTYSRIPADELYHVSHGGLRGGAGRAVVFANFSTALVALAVLAVVFDRLSGRVARATAVVAAVLCAAVFWPGVVNEADLDVKPVNALAAIGVLLSLALTVVIARRRGVSSWRWERADAARVAVAVVLIVVALPWIAAEVGVFLDDVPLVGHVFLTGKHVHDVHGLPAFPPAVHHGHHHGMDGLLLVLSALLLSRAVVSMRSSLLRTVSIAYLSLMLCYGIGNIANDFWIEQVVKRGWTTWEIPNVLEPRVTVAWAIIVVSATAIWTVAMLRDRRDAVQPPSRLGAAAQRE
jgi:hypothetical protein